jgi:outer membrane autotransporter protein
LPSPPIKRLCRQNQILTNGPDGNRQIDRLSAARGASSGTAPAGFTGGSELGLAQLSPDGASDGFRLGGLLQRQRAVAPGGVTPTPLPDTGLGLSDLGQNDQPLGGLSPLSLSGSVEENMQLSFSTSLSKVLQYNADVARRKQDSVTGTALGLDKGGLTGSQLAFLPWDVWLEGHIATAEGAGGADTQFGVLHAGFDYVVDPRLLVGLSVHYDSLRLKSTEKAYEASGSGWMIGPYGTLALSDHVFVQGRLAAGRSDNSVAPLLTYSDSFETSRWLASVNLVGSWQYGPLTFRPAASFAYMSEQSDSYADSFGVTIPGVRKTLGHAKIGPEVFYERVLSDGTVLAPHAALQAIINLGNSNVDTAIIDGTDAGPEGVRGNVTAGMRASLVNGISLDIDGSYDGIGTDAYEAVSGRAAINVPLN